MKNLILVLIAILVLVGILMISRTKVSPTGLSQRQEADLARMIELTSRQYSLENKSFKAQMEVFESQIK